MAINNNVAVEKYQTIDNANLAINSLNSRIKNIHDSQVDDYVELSRSIAKSHDNLTRWIIASASLHVGTLAALLIVIVR